MKTWVHAFIGGITAIFVGSLLIFFAVYTQRICADGEVCSRTILSTIVYFMMYPLKTVLYNISLLNSSWQLVIVPVYFFTIGGVIGVLLGARRGPPKVHYVNPKRINREDIEFK